MRKMSYFCSRNISPIYKSNMEKEIIKESVGEALQHAGEPTTITTEVIELDRDRVTSQTDVPPEVFEFHLNGVPCFPRCDVSVLTGQQKTGKTTI